MLCAFAGPPNIIRLHGRGEVAEPQDAAFGSLLAHFTPALGIRAIIRVEVDRRGAEVRTMSGYYP